jgi:hypothetical protein
MSSGPGFSRNRPNILLKSEEPTEVADKSCGKKLCYSIGTTALIRANEERYILFALTKTNHENCKVYSDVELMWRSRRHCWKVFFAIVSAS